MGYSDCMALHKRSKPTRITQWQGTEENAFWASDLKCIELYWVTRRRKKIEKYKTKAALLSHPFTTNDQAETVRLL